MSHFVETHHDELVARCRRRVGSRLMPRPTALELEQGIPLFLRQLADMLGGRPPPPGEISDTAAKHGGDMQRHGFTIAQVVHDYGDACQSITELAIERSVAISTEDFRALNDCLDHAIADAVTGFSRRQGVAAPAEGTDSANERLGYLAHELRNFLGAATLAFEVLKNGGVGVRGSTGAVLSRSLIGMRDLIDNSLSDVRLTAGIQTREPIAVRGFIEEIEVAALTEANSRGVRLTIGPVAADVAVQGDRQILWSIVSNLLQNALKFTRPGTEVTLSTRVTADRVLIEVEDECGGLPAGMQERLFRPFAQGGIDRRGMGLGLAICQRGAAALGARIAVRDDPGRGCRFWIDLARNPVA